jgi:hypothetical protein
MPVMMCRLRRSSRIGDAGQMRVLTEKRIIMGKPIDENTD